jgi:hypothetical protein
MQKRYYFDNSVMMGRRRMHIGNWWKTQMGSDHWEDQGVVG